MNIGIVGYGFVGQAVRYGFEKKYSEEGYQHPPNKVYIYDKYKKSLSLEFVVDRSEIIFICLPTPFHEDKMKIDLSICAKILDQICKMIPENSGKIVVVKSTVIPSSTSKWGEIWQHVPFVFNPEFLTESNYLNDFVNTDRIVIGAKNNWAAQRLIMLYRHCPWFRDTKILTMSPTAAEIVKYQSNILLGAKVTISNVVYDVCEQLGVNYNDVKEAVGLDKRIGSSHINVTSTRGYGGKCIPKDLASFVGLGRNLKCDMTVLEAMHNYNLSIRKDYDWREIAGASVGGRKYEEEGENE